MTQPHEAIHEDGSTIKKLVIPLDEIDAPDEKEEVIVDVAQAKLEAPKPDDVLKPIGGVMPLDHEDAMEMIEEFFMPLPGG